MGGLQFCRSLIILYLKSNKSKNKSKTGVVISLRYEIIEILVNGRKIVGYKLRDIYGTVSNYSLEQALKLAKQGLIVNATYNKYRQGLDGVNGIKLSALKRTQYTRKLGQSNHESIDI